MLNNSNDIDFDDGIDFNDDFTLEELSDKIKDDVDVEKLILTIKRYRNEIDFLKKLKEKRCEPIDLKIEKLNSNEEKLRSFILECMTNLFPEKNSVDFPGVGKISKRKTTGKWVVIDEEKYMELTKKHGLYDEAVKITTSVDKKKVPNVVSRILQDSGPNQLEGVKYEEPESDTILVLKLHEEKTEKTDEVGF